MSQIEKLGKLRLPEMGSAFRMNKMRQRRFSPIRNYDDINFKNYNVRIKSQFNPTLPTS